MIGEPKYIVGDTVCFTLEGVKYSGKVFVVDKWGTFEDTSNVSYDIFVESEPCLYKHVPEHCVEMDDYDRGLIAEAKKLLWEEIESDEYAHSEEARRIIHRIMMDEMHRCEGDIR